MTDIEQREAARQFHNKWHGRGNEDQDGRSYWLDILTNILGIENATDRVDFEKRVKVDGNTKKIDVYIPETKTIIEQKSLGIALDKPGHQSGGIELTPYQQAKRYNDNLPLDEKAKWIVTSNFAEIWIYDMNTVEPEKSVKKISLDEIQGKFILLDFLVNKGVKQISHEMEISMQAGEIVGVLYEALLAQYDNPTDDELKSLNMLCVRLVFCLYAEDAGVFGKHTMFHDYLQEFDARHTRKALVDLFEILNTKIEDRDKYLEPELAQFPYVNGGLFSDNSIAVPPITEEIRALILKKSSEDFDWSQISPTIFGAVFESTLNPETRRSGGMHYTSVENIHKVIDPLFLDDLYSEFNEIKQSKQVNKRKQRLEEFCEKLGSLKFLDPACGSGNFLTETYISLRKLENKALEIILSEQVNFEDFDKIKVTIDQFYGIEINDFAVNVAKTALWIAESQMIKETESIISRNLRIAKRYTDEERNKLAGALGIFIRTLDKLFKSSGTIDVLGDTFESLGLTDEYKGQFFTPFHICEFMGKCILGGQDFDYKKEIKQKGYITVCEPCIGAGKLVLGFAKAMFDERMNPQQELLVVGCDIDLKCVYMSYLQLSLYGIPAVIIHGNALTDEQWSVWKTPAYVVGLWDYKIRKNTYINEEKEQTEIQNFFANSDGQLTLF